MIKKVEAKAKRLVKEVIEFPEQFTLRELTRSDTAKRLNLDNQPKGEALKNLRKTAWAMVEVREKLQRPKAYEWELDEVFPIYVSSGYRSPELNKHIPGSSNTSAHTLGWAVDFKCPGFGTPYEVAAKIAASGIKFDQLIYEYGAWVHISFDPRMRQQILTIDKSGVRSGLHL